MRPQAPVRTLSCLVDPKNHKATKPGSQSLLLSSPQPQAHPCNPSSYHGSVVLLRQVSPHRLPALNFAGSPWPSGHRPAPHSAQGAYNISHCPASLPSPLCPSLTHPSHTNCPQALSSPGLRSCRTPVPTALSLTPRVTGGSAQTLPMSAQRTPKEHRGCALCWALGSGSEHDKLSLCPGYVVAPPEEANVRFR